MLTVNHVVVGAALGNTVKNPILAFLIGIITHFLMDKIPHFFPDKFSKQKVVFSIDALISLALVIFIYLRHGFTPIFFGALGGVLPDFILVPSKWVRETPVGKWHVARQKHLEKPLLLALEVLLFFSITFYLYNVRGW